MPLTTYVSGEILTASSLNANLSFAASSAVAQVKSTIKSDSFTTNSITYTDVTDLSVSITPTSATNKVLVFFSVNGTGTTGQTNAYVQLVRDSTAIAIGDTAGSRGRATTGLNSTGSNNIFSAGTTFLDSPATTAATTYKVQVRRHGSGTVFINRSETDTNTDDFGRYVSTITVMEVTP